MVDIEPARHAEKELEHADTTGARGEKMAALVHEHKNGKKQKAPKYGSDDAKNVFHITSTYQKAARERGQSKP